MKGRPRGVAYLRARRSGEIVASRETAVGGRFPVSEPRTVTVRGISEPVEVVTVDWR